MLRLTILIILFSLLSAFLPVYADGGANSNSNSNSNSESMQVLKQFNNKDDSDASVVQIDDKTKRKIMFYMAVPLLILLIITVALGVAMALFGKQVFVAHMICAGLSLSLAIAHAVVGIAWFAPW